MKNLITLIALVFVGSCFAQPPGDHDNRKDKIKAHKIAFISTELSLTPDEAEKFWPVYNELEDKMEAIHKEKRQALNKLRDFETLSDEEAYNLTEKIFTLDEKETTLRREYLAKFAAVIGKKKAAQVFIAEEKFKRELLRKLKNGNDQQEHPPGGPGKDGPPPRDN